jgi:hypothetical protein
MFVVYSFSIMRIYLALLVIIVGMAVFVSRQDERAAQQAAQKAAQLHKSATAAKPDEQHPEENIPNPAGDTPGWYGFFRWPNGTATLALILTLLAIAEQTKHTARAFSR